VVVNVIAEVVIELGWDVTVLARLGTVRARLLDEEVLVELEDLLASQRIRGRYLFGRDAR
jgi:hypothetical protein